MEKFIKLAIVVALLYFGFSYGRPWIEDLLDTEIVGADGSDSGRCLRQARRAVDEVAERIDRLGSPPYDVGGWERGRGLMQGEVNRAVGSCTCDEPACNQAQSVLGQLSSQIGEAGQLISRNRDLDHVSRSLEDLGRRLDGLERELDGGL